MTFACTRACHFDLFYLFDSFARHLKNKKKKIVLIFRSRYQVKNVKKNKKESANRT